MCKKQRTCNLMTKKSESSKIKGKKFHYMLIAKGSAKTILI